MGNRMLIYFQMLIICFVFLITVLFVLIGVFFPKNSNYVGADGSKTIDIYGSQITYNYQDGNDPVIIMLHGFGEDLRIWNPISTHLDNKILAIDQVGYGRSANPSIGYDIQTMSDYLIEFMDITNTKQAILMGHSMGASIAIWTASKHPDRILALILFAPSGYPGSLTYPFPISLVYKPGVLNRITAKLAHSDLFGLVFPKSLARQVLDITNSYDIRFKETLVNVNQPTLFLWSRGDKKVPIKYSKGYLDKMKNAMLVELPEKIGHPIPDVLSDETREEIKLFISSVSKTF